MPGSSGPVWRGWWYQRGGWYQRGWRDRQNWRGWLAWRRLSALRGWRDRQNWRGWLAWRGWPAWRRLSALRGWRDRQSWRGLSAWRGWPAWRGWWHQRGWRDRQSWRGWPGWPALVGLGLGLLAIGPGLAPGYLLSYDMVFVPNPPLSAALLGLTGGPPRAVPSDAVVAILSRVIPGDVVQKMILILLFVLACSGAAALLTRCWRAATGQGPPLLAALAVGVCYSWNPFVAERLLIGQWALLLGYAGLPWVVGALCAGRRRIRPWPLCAALLPAAVGGFAAMAVTGLAAAAVAWFGADRGWRARRLALTALALGLLSLPWLIPALAVPVHTDPRGADAFAARADTPFGRVGSLLMLSGIWNAQTVPRGYGGGASAAWLLVVLAGGCGYLLVARSVRLCSGLGVAALAGFALAAVGLTPASRAALADLVRLWPGFAVLRDGQQYLAPLALAEAVGLGSAVTWLLSGRPAIEASAAGPAPGVPEASAAGPAPGVRDVGSVRAAVALGVMAVLAPVLLLPGLAWGCAGRLRPVEYPADWLAARRIIDGGRAAGSVLLLPWAAYRRYPWNHFEAVYDPWSRLTGRELIMNDALRVGSLTVAAESADSIRLGRLLAAAGPRTRVLAAAGVGYVVVDAGPLLSAPRSALPALARLPGASVLLDGRDLVLLALPRPGQEPG